MKELAEQRAHGQLPFPESFVWLAATVVLTVGLQFVTRGLSDAGRWAFLYAGPAVSGVLAFFVSRLADPSFARGCVKGVTLVLLIVPAFLAEPLVGLVAATAIALGSFAFIIVTLSRAFELGQRQSQSNRHGR